MILLFDIDGTLISCGGAGRRALVRAFDEVLAAPEALDEVRFAGSTDPLIIEDAFKKWRGHAPEPADPVEELLEAYLRHLEAELAREDAGYQVLRGAHELLEALTRARHSVLGLATGNVERGARLKLKRGGLDSFFSFGGYGSDARARADMVRAAVQRGRAQAERQLGRSVEMAEILVLGDTERDVEAARAAGAQSVGILEGSGHRDALEASNPDLLVRSLLDPELWDRLGLGEPAMS